MAPRTKTIMLPQELDSYQLLTNSINMLSDRIEKNETDFVVHLKKVEDRLDQIVDLTRTVALLQQQASQQNDQITEVRTQLRDYSNKADTSIGRIHTRLDEIKNQQADKIDLNAKELEIKVKAAEAQASNTEKELKQWLNRGWGVWAIASLIFIGMQSMGYRWLDSLEKEKAESAHQMNTLVKDTSKHVQVLENVVNISKDNQMSIKRLEQMVADNERQVEYLRSRK